MHGAEHLANSWRKYQQTLDPIWRIDHVIASGNEVVHEWSYDWARPDTHARIMSRGSEWYVMRDARIAEVRAYFIADTESDAELPQGRSGSRVFVAESGLKAVGLAE